jgi:hypothetical protein
MACAGDDKPLLTTTTFPLFTRGSACKLSAWPWRLKNTTIMKPVHTTWLELGCYDINQYIKNNHPASYQSPANLLAPVGLRLAAPELFCITILPNHGEELLSKKEESIQWDTLHWFRYLSHMISHRLFLPVAKACFKSMTGKDAEQTIIKCVTTQAKYKSYS